MSKPTHAELHEALKEIIKREYDEAFFRVIMALKLGILPTKEEVSNFVTSRLVFENYQRIWDEETEKALKPFTDQEVKDQG